MYLELFLFAEMIPSKLYICRLFTKRYATKCRDIGLTLGLTPEELDIMEADHPNEIEDFCNEMLQKWLEKETKPTWEKLFNAADNPSFSINSG